MSRFSRPRLALACILVAFATAAPAADTVRPEVGNPLKAAQALNKSGQHKEALAKINEADAVAGKTAYESFLVQEMRGSVANAAGDLDTAVRSFEAVIASGRVSGREQLQLVQAVAVDYYKLKNYGKAAQWSQRYFKDGGTEGSMRTVLLQSYFLGNDCAAVAKMLGPASEEGSGRKPTEEELQILANCYLRQKDTGGYVSAIERLVVFYPKKEYWTDLLARVQKKPGFSDRLSVHVYRLRLATGNFTGATDYMELAQLALQAGVPAEAKMVMDKGYASGMLGKGGEAERQGRLRDLVNRSLEASRKSRAQDEQNALAAPDGNDLVKIGLNYVYDGQPDKGLALVERGIKKDGFKRPEDAKLLLGEAQIVAGHRARAAQTLRSVHGTDGSADIARLWVLQARA
jgi:tetratricopeptide (TPR) repeat protein